MTLRWPREAPCKFPDLIELWKDCGRLTIFLGLEKIDAAGQTSVNQSDEEVSSLS